jgi:hypothetical protein
MVDDDFNCNDILLNHMEEKNPNVILSQLNVLGYHPWWDLPLRHGILQVRPIKVFFEAQI